MKTIVVLPAYNAAKTLAGVVSEIPSVVDEIILVDDASHDDTVNVAKNLGLQVFVHEQNRGYGANQKTCYNIALERGADLIIMLHPDGQHDPTQLIEFITLLGKDQNSVVYGSRMYNLDNYNLEIPFWRYFTNIVLTKFANLLLRAKITDWHTGYRGYNRAVLESIDYESFPDGFEFDTYMTTHLVKQGFKMEEIFVPAKYFKDSSSISFSRSVKYGLHFVYMIIWNLR